MSLTVKVCPVGICRFYLQLSLHPLALDKNLTVYRFSLQKMLQLLQTKVARLSTPEFAKATRSINRSLAKDGLGPDENVSEDLRQGPYFPSFLFECPPLLISIQRAEQGSRANLYPSTYRRTFQKLFWHRTGISNPMSTLVLCFSNC